MSASTRGKAQAGAPAAHNEDETLRRRVAAAQHLTALFQGNGSLAAQTTAAYAELLDEVIFDVAQEMHRECKTAGACDCPPVNGPVVLAVPPRPQPLPPKLGTKGPVDIFGQSHPAKATDVVTCKNCGRQVQAGSFAPHLEKCLGKGRAAARAASRRIQGQA